MRFFLATCLLTSAVAQAQDVDASDILFLKVQELEGEISALRSELEAQAYLIDKLLNENEVSSPPNIQISQDTSIPDNTFRFEGINDSQSIEEVYDQGISALNNKNFAEAKKAFGYLASNFNDDEKIPLSLFWLGEISLLESKLEESEDFFQNLAINYPEHWRTPLAHKKMGDILMMSDETEAAKIKYQFVVQTYPSNAASSLALQLLENME
ncbi:tol-pal system protein [Gammaproteobacteria bacterium]|nr:tol-pal system protein [Gammaproteobacteria bacterium]MDA8925468.1 tol-pal system protein [Gammaproteobacteria bacterium]MDA9049037.1 tol-pal system protein [Gammaproteobacteria bacterium]MDA9153978.1 tol-pal system protein [Gammaproteobacteria bacterium]MDA9340866.1 tol-pal system protein [Gammaproteobacteria bacterium]